MANSALPVVPPGMVYTDTDGVIVYANRQFLDMLSIGSSRAPAGAPLEEALHLQPGELEKFLASRERYSQRKLALVYQRADGATAVFLLSSVPAYDQRGKFVGMNVGIDQRANADNLGDTPILIVPGFTLPAEFPEPSPPDPSLNGQYLEAVLNSLQGMLARLAGPRVREGLVKALSQQADKRDWPIVAEDSGLTLERRDIAPEQGAQIISEALEFAVAVLGQRVVLYEIEELYAQLDPRLQEYALRSGISLPLIKRLAT